MGCAAIVVKLESNMIDELKRRIISKKLWVFSVATFLFYISKLSEDNWLILALAYFGADVAEKIKLKLS